MIPVIDGMVTGLHGCRRFEGEKHQYHLGPLHMNILDSESPQPIMDTSNGGGGGRIKYILHHQCSIIHSSFDNGRFLNFQRYYKYLYFSAIIVTCMYVYKMTSHTKLIIPLLKGHSMWNMLCMIEVHWRKRKKIIYYRNGDCFRYLICIPQLN